MTFSGLESVLLASFCSLVVGIAVRMRSVSPAACQIHRDANEKVVNQLKKSNDIQFRMLRVLVAHSDLPAEIKAEILNMTE